MNITWALLMMALGSVGVQQNQHDAEVAIALKSAMNPPIIAAQNNNSNGSTPAPNATAEANDSQSMLHADPQPDAPKVKGIYVTAYSAGGERMEKLLSLLDQTELNSMVIDIKDDAGYITYKTENPELQKLGNPQPFIGDINKLMERLNKHDVYPIARIVVFKDSILAKRTRNYPLLMQTAQYGRIKAAIALLILIMKMSGSTMSISPKKLSNSALKKFNSTMCAFLKDSKNVQTHLNTPKPAILA